MEPSRGKFTTRPKQPGSGAIRAALAAGGNLGQGDWRVPADKRNGLRQRGHAGARSPPNPQTRGQGLSKDALCCTSQSHGHGPRNMACGEKTSLLITKRTLGTSALGCTCPGRSNYGFRNGCCSDGQGLTVGGLACVAKEAAACTTRIMRHASSPRAVCGSGCRGDCGEERVFLPGALPKGPRGRRSPLRPPRRSPRR